MKIKKNDILYFLSIVLILSQFCYPFRDIFPKILVLVCGIIFIFNIFLYEYKNKIFLLLLGINIFIFLRIIFSGNYSFDFFAPINVFIQFFLLLQAYSIYCFLKKIKKESENRVKKIIKISLYSLILTMLFSLYYIFFIDPQAIRNTQRQFLLGAGDFELVYTLSFIVGSLFCLKNKRRYFFFYMLSFITILKSNLVTSCVILFITCLIYILSLFRNKKIILLNFNFLGIIFILLREKLIGLFLYLSKSNFFYWSTQKKLYAIASLLNGKFDNLDTLNVRWKLINQSLNSFKQNFLFGLNYKYMKQGTIGGHAGWADMLARFGFIGTIIILVTFISIYFEQVKNIKTNSEKRAIKISWILFIILGFLNPNLMGAVLYSIFIISPFISVLEIEKRKEKIKI